MFMKPKVIHANLKLLNSNFYIYKALKHPLLNQYYESLVEVIFICEMHYIHWKDLPCCLVGLHFTEMVH